MTHWTFHGSALLPDQSYDAQGVYSGSALVIDDALHLFYTGNVKQDGQRRSSQCLAISTDGQHFLKTGPMFTTPDGYTEHFRDPKVFHAGSRYWMVIGAQQRTGKGAIVLFSSSDAQHWNLIGPVAQSEACQMIECPDLFLIDDTAVLLYCPQWRDNAHDLALHSFAAYKLTHFDTAAGTLDDRSLDDNQHLLDQGFDFYAPQTLQTPDLAGIYVAANGQQGVCQAIEDLGLRRKVKVIAFDLNEITMQLLQSDRLSCVLDQKAFEQGYRSPYVLYEYITHKKSPQSELIYTDIAIRTKYNSDLEITMTPELPQKA
nr:substrate-binding domain-containing protein [Butyricicoccus pullicaecorum]